MYHHNLSQIMTFLSYLPVYVHPVPVTGRQNSSSMALNSVIIWFGETEEQEQNLFFWKINRIHLRDTLTFKEKMPFFFSRILNDEQIRFLSFFFCFIFKSSRFTLHFFVFFKCHQKVLPCRAVVRVSCSSAMDEKLRKCILKFRLDQSDFDRSLRSLYIRVAIIITAGPDVRATTESAPSSHRRVTSQLLRPHPRTAAD